MASRTICVALLLTTLPVAGCGTAANLVRQRPGAGGVSPFGGVRHDVWCIRSAANGDPVLQSHPNFMSRRYPQALLMLACAADLPFSFVGDVVTWPYTAVYTYINQPIPVPPVVLIPPVVQAGPVPPDAQPTPMLLPPAPQPTPATLPPQAQPDPIPGPPAAPPAPLPAAEKQQPAPAPATDKK
jgi:hypothetical protein